MQQAKQKFPCDEKRENDIAAFQAACRFAKSVKTAAGPAILIGGEVVGIFSSDEEVHLEAIVRALRSGSGDAVERNPSGNIAPVWLGQFKQVGANEWRDPLDGTTYQVPVWTAEVKDNPDLKNPLLDGEE